MDILIIGDSLTAGWPGACFTRVFKKRYPGCVAAYGVGGDTLTGITRRVQYALSQWNPDVLVIEAGTNDVLLPYLEERGNHWGKLVNRLKARGSVPVGVERFEAVYSRALERIPQHVYCIVTTITCLGEDITSDLNKRREEYNSVIRNLPEHYNVHVADTGKVFDTALRALDEPSTYLLPSYYKIFTDSLLTVIERFSDVLSANRGLALTMDGVHFNRRGAYLFGKSILP